MRPLQIRLRKQALLIQIGGDGWIFPFGCIPDEELAALEVHQQIEVQPHTSYAGRQIGDVPSPNSFGTAALRHGTGRASCGGRAYAITAKSHQEMIHTYCKGISSKQVTKTIHAEILIQRLNGIYF